MKSKAERFQEFLARMRAAPSPNSADDAFILLARTLNEVEDEFSGVPFQPELWRHDGRMYPPQEDSRVKSLENASLRKYRSKAHYTIFGLNGSIRIQTLQGEVLLDKAGQDGRRAIELEL